MIENTQENCQPSTDLADQPKPPPPGGQCGKIEDPGPPKFDPGTCAPAKPECGCPKTPGPSSNCLQELIDEQSESVAKIETAKAFQNELQGFLERTKGGSQEYTRDKRDELIEKWVAQDRKIVDLIRRLVCVFPCWGCIIECYVCPRLNALVDAGKRLQGKEGLHTNLGEVHNLYDLRYWHERERARKQHRFDDIKAVLGAWEKPAQTIEKALTDNAKEIEDANKALGTNDPKVVYDVFLRIVPLHLAIAPPSGSPWKTGISKDYTQFCECDKGESDTCCGPDVGRPSLRQRLIGPQPYLIDPGDYFTLICCLVEHRYKPAKDALATAEACFQRYDDEIKRLEAEIESGLKSFDKDAKANIPSKVICCKEKVQQPSPPQETAS